MQVHLASSTYELKDMREHYPVAYADTAIAKWQSNMMTSTCVAGIGAPARIVEHFQASRCTILVDVDKFLGSDGCRLPGGQMQGSASKELKNSSF